MENNLLEILKILSSFNQNSPHQGQNVGIQSYPNEAYSPSQTPSFENNLLPMLFSILTKGGNSPLTEIFTKNNGDSNHKDFQPPNDEILL